MREYWKSTIGKMSFVNRYNGLSESGFVTEMETILAQVLGLNRDRSNRFETASSSAIRKAQVTPRSCGEAGGRFQIAAISNQGAVPVGLAPDLFGPFASC